MSDGELERKRLELEVKLLHLEIDRRGRETERLDKSATDHHRSGFEHFWQQSWPRTVAVLTLALAILGGLRELAAYYSDQRQKWNELFQEFVGLATDVNESKQAAGIAGLSTMWGNSDRDNHVAAELIATSLLAGSEMVSSAAATAVGASVSWPASKNRCDAKLSSLFYGKGGDWGVITRIAHVVTDSPRKTRLKTRDFGCLTARDPNTAVHDCRARLLMRPHQSGYEGLPKEDRILELRLEGIREAIHRGWRCLHDA